MNGPSVGTLAMTSGVNGTRAAAGAAPKRQPRLKGPAGSSPGSDAGWVRGPGGWPAPPRLQTWTTCASLVPSVPGYLTHRLQVMPSAFQGQGQHRPLLPHSWEASVRLHGGGRGGGPWLWLLELGLWLETGSAEGEGKPETDALPAASVRRPPPRPGPFLTGHYRPWAPPGKGLSISPWRTLTPKLAHSPPPTLQAPRRRGVPQDLSSCVWLVSLSRTRSGSSGVSHSHH